MLRNLINWCLDNLAVGIGLTLYIIFQTFSFVGFISPDSIQKYVPLFFYSILIIILVSSQKQQKQIEELKVYLNADKVEFIDRTAPFFDKLIKLVDEKSVIDVFYVSKNPLDSFNHPSVKRYREKIDKLLTSNSENFRMRRLFIVNSKKIAESILKLFDKHNNSSSYYMKAMATDLDFAFTGYVIVNKRYCFIILPRFPYSDLKSVFIDSETISAAFLERYNELWKSSEEVDDSYCTYLRNLYSTS